MPTVTLDERATAAPFSWPITEATGRRRRVLIISPGQGTSGFYTAEVLERDAGAIRAGTHMYLDHPSRSEEQDRPERTVRDLAAVLETDAEWDGAGTDGPGLYATMRTFAHLDPIISELADHIGVSIRGHGQRSPDGMIESLDSVTSVDLVTQGGRGGRVLQLLESASPAGLVESRNVVQWMTSRMHTDFTVRADDMAADGLLTRDERVALSGAVGDALFSFESSILDAAPHLYDRDPYDVPTDPTTIPIDSQEATVPDIADLTARIEAVEAERDAAQADRDAATAERDTATAERDALVEAATAATRDHTARAAVTEALAHVQFATDTMRDDVVASLAARATLTEAGDVDTAALRETVAGRYPTPTGSTVTGLGEGATTTGDDTTALVEANAKAAADLFG